MCCRYNPGGDFAIHNQIMDSPEDAKYGMTREQLTEAFLKLKAKGVKHFGIHAFLASNTVTNAYYPKLARILFETAVELQQGDRRAYRIHQPFRRRGHPRTHRTRSPMTSWPSARVCTRHTMTFW